MSGLRPVIPLMLMLAVLGCEEGDDVEKPVSVLRGVITDEAAAPVPDAQVLLQVWDGSHSSLEEGDRSHSTPRSYRLDVILTVPDRSHDTLPGASIAHGRTFTRRNACSRPVWSWIRIQ